MLYCGRVLTVDQCLYDAFVFGTIFGDQAAGFDTSRIEIVFLISCRFLNIWPALQSSAAWWARMVRD